MAPLRDLMHATPALREALTILEADGHTAHLVGGAVRNTLMEMPVGDLDIATSAHPDIVAALFEAAGCTVHPTGIDHGTLTVVVDEMPFEITTWRRDVATDGRRATIAYAMHIGEDARRRDFTINALYADRRGDVVDPTGHGLADIARRRLAFIGQPGDRIREDHLRILRFYRFAATHDLEINPASPDASSCRTLASLVSSLPAERIGAEMRKLLGAPDPGSVLVDMCLSSVLDRVFHAAPESCIIRTRFSALRIAEATLGLSADPVTRMAVLLYHSHSAEMRLSKAESRRFRTLTTAAAGVAGPAELGYRLGAEAGRAALAIRAARYRGAPVSEQDALAIDAGAAARFPLNGGDLSHALSGPALGAALRDLEARWIDSGFALDKATLLSEVETSA